MQHRQFNRTIKRTDLHPPKTDDWKVKTNNQKGVSSRTSTLHEPNITKKKKKRPTPRSTSGRKMKLGKNSMPTP